MLIMNRFKSWIICAVTVHIYITKTWASKPPDMKFVPFVKFKDVEGAATEKFLPSYRSQLECAKLQAEAGSPGYAVRYQGDRVNCMMTSDRNLLPPGGWSIFVNPTDLVEAEVLIIRRIDGTTNFDRTWNDYKTSFGSKNTNYWIGLEQLHQITTSNNNPFVSFHLKVEMTSWDGASFWARYSTFRVGPESDNYRLSVSGYDSSSTAGHTLGYHNNYQFTTHDKDNDINNANCAGKYTGGFWYRSCCYTHPTGTYLQGGVNDQMGINWRNTGGYDAYYSWKTMVWYLVAT